MICRLLKWAIVGYAAYTVAILIALIIEPVED